MELIAIPGIETLLEESYNERMHLLIFLKMYEPGLFMRLLVLGAQGVFFNAMFISYLISPRTCHRFVGYLEEEAVLTYTKEIEAIESGRCPNWAKAKAPQIAIDYYNMPEGQQTLKDMLYYIRADESKHREVLSRWIELQQCIY
jgi:ubiquinol oxidase